MPRDSISFKNRRNIFSADAADGGEVRVWECLLDVDDEAMDRFRRILSEDENRRADGFHYERDRSRYTAAHGMLREILADSLDRDPRSLRFSMDDYGKPRLLAEPGDPDIRFSLTRSRSLALVAMAVGVEIGVDVEYMDQGMDILNVASGFMSAREYGKFSFLPASLRREAFFRCWTRKEAFLKGKGVGLAEDPAGFEVSLLPAEPPALLDFPSSPVDVGNWSLMDLAVHWGYLASLAIHVPIRIPGLTFHWSRV